MAHSVAQELQVCFTPSPCTTPKALHTMTSISAIIEAHDPLGPDLGASQQNSALCDQTAGLSISPPPVSPNNVAMLEAGTEVEIDGLIARPDFNGLCGVVQSWDPILRRYEVLLDKLPAGQGSRLVKTKRSNLHVRPPPPPTSAAALLATTLDLCSCLPSGVDSSNALVIDPSPIAHDSPGWTHVQFCDAGMSPSGDASRRSPEFYSTSEAIWDYNLDYSAASYELPENASWLESSFYDAQGWAEIA